MFGYSQIENRMCWDCGHDTFLLGEWFMLFNDIWWQAIGLDARIYMLCVGCVEERLGRKLNGNDFSRFGLNYSPDFKRSLRLRQRMNS